MASSPPHPLPVTSWPGSRMQNPGWKKWQMCGVTFDIWLNPGVWATCQNFFTAQLRLASVTLKSIRRAAFSAWEVRKATVWPIGVDNGGQ